MQKMVAVVSGKPQEKQWRNLQVATGRFVGEARRLLANESIPPSLSKDLFRYQKDVLTLASAIIRANDRENVESQRLIDEGSRALVFRAQWLLGSCVLLAMVCAVVTVSVTMQLFRRMEWQASELSRVSWQMVETQESAARRFSHELHDELGQSLTAVKANLAALDPGDAANSLDRKSVV